MLVSPSQIERWRLCKRSWGFVYLDGIKTPTSPAAAYGQEGHKAIEAWLTTGKIPDNTAEDILKLVHKAIKPGRLPTPDRRLLVEHKFQIGLLKSGHALRGYIDCVVPPELNHGVPLIIDHKFRTDRKFMMDQSDLEADIQALIYSFAALLMFPDCHAVENRWLYYFSTGSASKRPKRPVGVEAVGLTRHETDVEWSIAEILEVVAEMAKAKRTKDLEPSYSACSAFGGCYFVERCREGTTAATRAAARIRQAGGLASFKSEEKAEKRAIGAVTKEDDKMSLIDDLRAKRKAARGGKSEPKEPVEEAKEAANHLSGYQPETEGETEEEEKPKRKRGKPKKTSSKKVKEVQTEETSDAEEEKSEQVNPKPLFNPGRFRLLINTFPVKTDGRPIHRLEEIVAEATATIERDFDVQHWKLIEYGRDKPMLELAFDQWLDEHDLDGDICVDSRTAVGQALMELLTRKAEEVFRGYF